MAHNARDEHDNMALGGVDAGAAVPVRKKARRGFAAMDPARQKAIASKGGRASHEKGTGHEWDSEKARLAGRKGGLASHGGRGKQAGQAKVDAPST